MLSIALLAMLMSPSAAETRTWSGSGDWSDGANWTPAGVPTATSAVVFDGTSTNACAIDAAATPTIAGLAIAAAYSGTIAQGAGTAVVVGALGVTIAGGTLVASVAGISVAGSWTKTGGTFTAGSGTVTFNPSSGSTSVLTSGGTGAGSAFANLVVSGAGTVRLASDGVSATGLTVSAGVLDLNGEDLGLAASGAVVNNGHIQLQGGETLLNITSLDLDSGTVVYTGRGLSETFTLKDFGATDYHHLVLGEGLLGYWKLDESGSPAALIDASGRGRSATTSGGQVATAAAPSVGFTDPGSMVFDGIDDTATANVDLSRTSTATLAFWLWWDAYADDDDLAFEFCPAGSLFNFSDAGFLVDPNSSNGGLGRFEIAVKGDAGFNNALFVRPSTGSWHHYAIVFDKTAAAAGEITPYVDGVNVSYVKLDSSENTNSFGDLSLSFMARQGPSLCGAGRLDDLRIYDRALTPLEISALVIGNQGTVGTTTWALGADLAVAGDLTLCGGVLDVGVANRAIFVTGSWLNHGATVEPRSGTVTLAGAGGGSVISGSQTFHDLTVCGAGTYVMGDRLRVENTLTIGPGTFDVSSGRWPLHAGSIVQTTGALVPRDGVATVIVGGSAAGSLSTTATLNRLRVEGSDDAGLCGYWKMDEGAGATLRDRSGNGSHCAVFGAPRWIATVPSVPTFRNAAAMEFSGDVGGALGARPLVAVDNWTLAAWIRPSILPQVEGTVVYVGDNAGGYGFTVGGADSTIYGLYGSVAWISSGYTIPTAGIWHHVVMRRSSGTTTFWVDGVQTANTSASAPRSPNDMMAIGYQPGGANREFVGGIDDVRVYSRALTVAEIRNLANGRYAAGDNGPVTSLGADLAAASMHLDSGVFNANVRAVTVTAPVSLAQGGGAWIAGSGTHAFNGGFSLSGSSFTGGAGTVDINGSFVQSAMVDPIGGVAQSGGVFTAPSGTMSLTGSFTRASSAGTFAHNGGTLVLDGAAAGQGITSGGASFNAVQVTGAGGWTLNDAFAAIGPLSIVNGSFDVSGDDHTVRVATVDQTAPGVFVAQQGTVVLDSATDRDLRLATSSLWRLGLADVAADSALVAHYAFDQVSGATEPDLAGGASNDTATLTGTRSSDVPTDVLANRTSLSCPGDGTGAVIPDPGAYELDFTTGDSITIAAWIKPVSSGDWAAIAIKGYHHPGFYVGNGTGNDGRLSFYYRAVLSDPGFQTPMNTVQYGVWQHVAVVCTPGVAASAKIYWNGVAVANCTWTSGTGNEASLADVPSDWRIGNYDITANQAFNGWIDDVRIYRRILSAAEIASVAAGGPADGGSTTNAASLVSYLALEEGSG
ncbi:MAG TPA: LamG-like jellyroll fold domain-containing protein, partial [Planctomycetota bacterium]|nr:LamG-like jellyroll fold domain-containing protein [Planctomycetota bacterium]